MMIHKSREVQKTVWKSHKVIRLIHKSREVQKTVWKAHKFTRVM